MRFLRPGSSVRTVRRRAAAVCIAALLTSAISSGTGLAARVDHTRAITPGPVVAWGNGTLGQLGNGGTSSSPVPVRTSRVRQVIDLDGGAGHTVSLRTDGTVWTWGLNDRGQLGNGTTRSADRPVRVCAPGQTAPCSRPLTDVVAVSAGASHTLALRSDGTVVAWGGNEYGQLGDATSTDRSTPVQVCAPGQTAPCSSFLTGITNFDAGYWHNLAVQSGGTLHSWGLNSSGQLGDGSNVFNSTTPVQAALTGAPGNVAAGRYHSLAHMTDSTVRSWGFNGFGQLGNGTTTSTNLPVQVCAQGQTAPCAAFLTGVNEVAAGADYSLALPTDGTVRAWGDNGFGQLGDGTTAHRSTPVQTCAAGQTAPCGAFLTGVIGFAAGGYHTLALQSDLTLKGWGHNFSGQIGDGTTADRSTPVQVCAVRQTAPCSQPLGGVIAVAAGGDHSLATHH
ncbi:hypothetical protein [Streptomyces sp. NPDC091371]|uniref:RCC1-like domain-containing protein n=1 Tax=Streptomyces sp. NPDC091371 TaxID=3155303 RepID=UPI003447EC77